MILYLTYGSSLVAQLVKNLPAMQRPGFNPWDEKMSWRRERLPTPVFWLGESHGLYSPLDLKELDISEKLWLSLLGLPRWLSCWGICLEIFHAGDARNKGSIPELGRCPGVWQPTPVFLPEKSHGQGSLVDYRRRGREESDRTEHGYTWHVKI